MNQEHIDGRLRFVRALHFVDSQIDAEGVLRRLDETPIAIIIGSNTAGTFNTQVTALTALNLLGRLFRHLFICIPSNTRVDERLPFVQGQLDSALLQFATRVSPEIIAKSVVKPPVDAVELHISEENFDDNKRHIYCMGAGWLARVGRRPIDLSSASSDCGNPIGPLIAATLGVAEVFKLVFDDILQDAKPIEDISFSALTYQVQGKHIGPELDQVALQPTLLIGAGSIGSSFLWGLAHLRNAHGTLVIVDHDKLEQHNPDRAPLVLDNAAELGLEKSSWACDTVQPWLPKLKITPFTGTIRQYIDSLPPDYTLPLAISAVDSIESRRDIQDALPARILNASTGPTKIEITRHAHFGKDACLYCLYLPEILERSPIRLAMERTGFGQKDVAELMIPNNPRRLTAGNIRGIERRNDLAPGTLNEFIGRNLQELLEHNLWYSQAPIPLANGHALVTTAFVSALAGFLLLAETLKEANPALAPYRLNGIYEQELLSMPNEFLYPGQRDTTGYCFCWDTRTRQRLYKQKYGQGQTTQ
jgi:hypothetical protein